MTDSTPEPASTPTGERTDQIVTKCCDGQEHTITVVWPDAADSEGGVDFWSEPECTGDPSQWGNGLCDLLDDSSNYHLMVGRFVERKKLMTRPVPAEPTGEREAREDEMVCCELNCKTVAPFEIWGTGGFEDNTHACIAHLSGMVGPTDRVHLINHEPSVLEMVYGEETR